MLLLLIIYLFIYYFFTYVISWAEYRSELVISKEH